jgi:hypothetical protein
MKRIKLFEEFVNESTTDGTIESLIKITQMSMNMGVFDDKLMSKHSKFDLISGVKGAIKGEVTKLPTDKRKEFDRYADSLITPLENADTVEQLLRAMITIADTKRNIFSKLSITESLNESRVSDLLKKVKNATTKWWDEHKDNLLLYIAEILAQILVEILFGILRGLLKSTDLKAPKIKFGGGKFGGGGATSSW